MIQTSKEKLMNTEEWHYLWIKTLVEHGVTVESAEAAFKERYDLSDNIQVDRDPVQAARLYLDEHAPSITPVDTAV